MAWLDRMLWEEPLWVIGLVYVAALLAAAWVGLALGRRWGGTEATGGVPLATAQAALFGLLALLLAFTYSQAAARFETRQRLLVEEANAIGTLWLRADFLPEPARHELRATLRDYAALRVAREEARANLPATQESVRAAESLHTKMWALVTRPTQTRPSTPLDALLIAATNTLIDLHTSRLAAYQYRVPGAILLLLALVSVLSIALMGLSYGPSGRIGRGLLLVLAVVIAAVTTIILDLDHSHRGWTRVSQTYLQQLARPAPAPSGNRAAHRPGS